MAISFKTLDKLLKNYGTQMSKNSFEKLLDMIPTHQSNYSLGLKHEIPMIYAANNTIPYIDRNISSFTGVPEEKVYQDHRMALTGNLMPFDQTVFATEVYAVMRYFMRKDPNTKVVCRAKMKVSSFSKSTYWVIFEIQEAVHQNNLYEASLNVIYDISNVYQDNLHKFFYYDKDTQKIIYQNYYPSADITQYQLSRREVQIINLLADGYSSVEIADKLFVQKETIRKHRKNIIQKLSNHIKVRNTPHLVKFACQHGMIMNNSEFDNLWQKGEYQKCFQDYHYQ